MVDNASSDGSLELLAASSPGCGRSPTQQRRVRRGNNVALREVATPFVALINNDARPEPDWLRRLLEPFSEPGAERLGAVSAKIVFLPRFLAVELATPGSCPAPSTPGSWGCGCTGSRSTAPTSPSGCCGTGSPTGRRGRAGPLPLDPPVRDAAGPRRPPAGRAAAAAAAGRGRDDQAGGADLGGGSGGGKAEPEPVDLEVEVPAGVPLVDVLNNAGSMVFRDGYGADRAYQELDRGQYQRPEEVFAFCGGSVCFRTEALRQAGVFDDDFFLYYEDTDLSWRLRSLGWRIRYQPAAVARHIHSASSVEWSPLFVFHTDRNRLLMLTKNARAGLAAREVLRYP